LGLSFGASLMVFFFFLQKLKSRIRTRSTRHCSPSTRDSSSEFSPSPASYILPQLIFFPFLFSVKANLGFQAPWMSSSS
jgi:hypothetical protein